MKHEALVKIKQRQMSLPEASTSGRAHNMRGQSTLGVCNAAVLFCVTSERKEAKDGDSFN